MASASLSIPIAFWSKNVSTSTISSTLACADYIVAGLEDGLIWVFKITSSELDKNSAGHAQANPITLQPQTLLSGHNSRVTALEAMLVEGDTKSTCEWILISASEDGEVKKWTLADGRCLQSNPEAFIGVPAYLGLFFTVDKSGSTPKFIVCAGASNEACILDSTSLEIVRVWGGHQDWIVCIQAQKKACHPIPCPENESFAGAEFISVKEIVLWTQSGHVFLYSIDGEQQENSHPIINENSSSTVEPRYVCDWKLRLAYLPTILAFKNNGFPYLLSLQNDCEGLRYSYTKLKGSSEEYSGSKAPSTQEGRVQWRSNNSDTFSKSVVTYSVMLDDTLVALGCKSGHIWVSQVDEALNALVSGFNSLPSKETRILKGHVGPITSIFTSDELMQRSFLLTGGMDCSARIWNIESGTEVACFNNHSRPVAHFLQVPEGANSRIRKSVISIAEDQSVAIISIEEMNCIYLFGGYGHELLSIQWRPPEDYIVLWYADGSAFVWQMQTGHLDRIVKGEAAREIMSDSRWSVSETSRARSHSSKLAFDCMTIPLHEAVSAQTITINLKHILNILSPARLGEQQGDFTSSPAPTSQQSSSAPDAKPSGRRQRIFSGQPKSSAKSKATPPDQPVSLPESVQRCLNAAKAILGLLITEDDAHTVSIRGLLGLSHPSHAVALGMKGAYGNISIQAPSEDTSMSESWCVSPALTASKFIAILSLCKIIASVQNLGVDMDTWSKGYCSAVQDTVGAKFQPPSLSYLAKYWQDPQVEIQEATKIIMLSTIERLSKPEITSLIKYWSAYLPAAALPDSFSSQFMARSAVILGILGAENVEALPEKIRKLVALSLTILLNDDSRVSYKIASIDLLAQGFASWQPYIRADAVLNTLFAMAMDSLPSNTLVSRRSRRAIAQIAVINPVLFVATLTQDILDAKKPSDRVGLLKLVSIFSRKNPTVLYNGIARLAEAMVKSLDPTVPQIREALLPVATSVLMDLVLSFPQTDFHVGSQKLAVGTLEGAIIVYDLQTATRWQILEGHHKAVSAVSFSRDGKTIVSCSIKEGTVRFWHPNPGFFGMLMGSGIWGHSKSGSTGSTTQGQQGGIPSLSSQQSSRTFDFALQDSIVTGSEESMLSHVRFEWIGDRVVKLSVFDHIMSFNV
ncbi:hypothetical protein BGX26_001535 [Mortierella sp. AD094]|nr:hypothetical protein BGX26_001535 [Mortierella sp. AD094]